MTRVALYARYSSDKQREASIEDQIRLCEERAAREGWKVVQHYTDHAISGASLMRPGIQALMQDAQGKKFDLVLTESLDRISRDQEDIAGVYKRLRFAGVQILTLSEGPVSELHIGFKGTMGALYLKDLADKTRRGLRGRVEAGKSGGGNSYGYDVVVKFTAAGEPERGDRRINESEAAIVRDIFTAYAAGKSPKAIAHALNRQKVPGPSGEGWAPSTINGNWRRGTGILNNPRSRTISPGSLRAGKSLKQFSRENRRAGAAASEHGRALPGAGCKAGGSPERGGEPGRSRGPVALAYRADRADAERRQARDQPVRRPRRHPDAGRKQRQAAH